MVVETVDYHGHPRNAGGDPIGAELTLAETIQSNQAAFVETEIKDLEDGTYEILFRPPNASRYILKVSVFERPIKDYPLYFDATEHNEPVKVYGRRGNGKDDFHQPVAVAVDDDGTIYIVDTGNSRIKVKEFENWVRDVKINSEVFVHQVLSYDLVFQRHITNEGLEGRSCTGIAVSEQGLVVVNWRTRIVTEMTSLGDTIKSFSYNGFQVLKACENSIFAK